MKRCCRSCYSVALSYVFMSNVLSCVKHIRWCLKKTKQRYMWLQRLLTFLRFYFKCSRCCLPINSKQAGHSDIWHWRSIFIQKTATQWILYFFMPLSVYPRDGCVCVCVCAINNIKIYNSKIQHWCCKSKKSCRNIMIWSSLCYWCCCF